MSAATQFILAHSGQSMSDAGLTTLMELMAAEATPEKRLDCLTYLLRVVRLEAPQLKILAQSPMVLQSGAMMLAVGRHVRAQAYAESRAAADQVSSWQYALRMLAALGWPL